MLEDPPPAQSATLENLREQAIALRQLLDIIRASRDDERPVFEAILDSAQRLCDAPVSGLILATPEDAFQTLAAHRNIPEGAVEMFASQQMPVDRNASYAARSIVDGRLIQFEDMGDSDLYRAEAPVVRTMVDQMQIRSVLFVPLMQDGRAIGTITLFRHKIQPFDPHQIELVETFASQAVIAIEKVHQFREVQTRLKRERATADVLKVVSESRDDDQPVFRAILEKAQRLCQAPLGFLLLADDAQTRLDLAAYHADSDPGQTSLDLDPEQYDMARVVTEGRVIQIDDFKETEKYRAGDPERKRAVEQLGIRTFAGVPLIRNGIGIGCIVLYRREVRPFSPDEIELVKGFAAQAVIAIENVRQFREVQTRLEREQASREILQVISASRTDPGPVFDTILKNATQLSGAPLANLCLLDDTRTHWHLAAHFGDGLRHLSVGRTTCLNDSSFVPATTMRTGEIVHVEDLTQTDLYRDGDPGRVAMVKREGMRTILGVPLLLNAQVVGCITLFRREVRAFSDDEIALVETFAAQAVIAIENVRQFLEVQTRLEREAATREILQVISQSPDDEQPVFDTILQKASQLCNVPDAALMLLNSAGTHYRIRAHRGEARIDIAETREWAVADPLPISQAFREAQTIHIADMTQSAPYLAGNPTYLRMVDDEGLRSRLCVPLMLQGKAFGVIALSRYEQLPFSKGEIDLIETFAAQAVIAIENVRQFRELQERLAREAATAEVLDVISRSRSNAQPVFHTILENAARLCGAPHAMLLLRDAEDKHLALAASNAAKSRFIDQLEENPHRLDNRESYAVTAVRERRVVHVDDLREASNRRGNVPQIKVALDLEGMRTVLQVPLLEEEHAIGVIALYKLEVAPFSEDQIELVKTFAAQAVIAIENTRQLHNLETLNAELGDRVTEQVGEIERMGKLKRFLPPAVADTVLTQGSDQMLSSHRALLGVLFCDIRGFTAFCETAEPEETIEVLQTYHEEMGKLINAHGAGVDHRMGDGIMVLFNDPLPCEDPAGDALRLAIAMRERMAELCKVWKRMGHRLGFGVGISLGYATVGMVGFEGRFDYTASGTAVNLASRLCDEAHDGEILLSPRAAIAVEDDFDVTSKGEAQLKGLREPLEIFRLAGDG